MLEEKRRRTDGVLWCALRRSVVDAMLGAPPDLDTVAGADEVRQRARRLCLLDRFSPPFRRPLTVHSP